MRKSSSSIQKQIHSSWWSHKFKRICMLKSLVSCFKILTMSYISFLFTCVMSSKIHHIAIDCSYNNYTMYQFIRKHFTEWGWIRKSKSNPITILLLTYHFWNTNESHHFAATNLDLICSPNSWAPSSFSLNPGIRALHASIHAVTFGNRVMSMPWTKRDDEN